MTDYSELKRLAEGARDGNENWLASAMLKDLFQKSVNPDLVLKLIAENEALRRDAERLDRLDQTCVPVVDGVGQYAELVAYRWFVDGQCSTVREAIDDYLAMDKEEQS